MRRGAQDAGGGLWQALRPVVSTHVVLPSRLQEAEKRHQALQQELAALREELRARGPAGE